MTLGTRPEGTFDCPHSPVGATASARSILAAVSAVHRRRLGKRYNVHSRGCAISGGPTDNKFRLSHFTTNFAGAGTPVRGRKFNAGRMSVQELFLRAVAYRVVSARFQQPYEADSDFSLDLHHYERPTIAIAGVPRSVAVQVRPTWSMSGTTSPRRRE